MPMWIHLFLVHNVRNVIDRLQFGKAKDHDGLVGDHFLYCPWYLAPIAKLCLTRRPPDAQQHRAIMIGIYVAKLYGSILDSEWSIWAEQKGWHSVAHAGFRKGFTTLDHILILWAIYCCFVDFWKAFDTMLCACLMQCLEASWCPYRYAMGIYALYESLSGKVWSPNGLSKAVACTTGGKQGCPLSPTLFGLYIADVSQYIERFGGSRACLIGIALQILLYVDDIVLISNSPDGLQRHLNALK